MVRVVFVPLGWSVRTRRSDGFGTDRMTRSPIAEIVLTATSIFVGSSTRFMRSSSATFRKSLTSREITFHVVSSKLIPETFPILHPRIPTTSFPINFALFMASLPKAGDHMNVTWSPFPPRGAPVPGRWPGATARGHPRPPTVRPGT